MQFLRIRGWLIALGLAAGCLQPGPVQVGGPAIVVASSSIDDARYESRSALSLDASAYDGYIPFGLGVGYYPVRARDTGNDAYLVVLDMGVFGELGSDVDDVDHVLVVVYGGASVVFVGEDGAGREAVGLGGYCRAGLEVALSMDAALQLYAILRGWVVSDGHGTGTAGLAGAGLNVTFAF